MEWEEIDGELL